jgi:hypothetical protein
MFYEVILLLQDIVNHFDFKQHSILQQSHLSQPPNILVFN